VKSAGISWFGIFRLGLVQAALGAIVVLTTSTLNRVMVVELALPALLPGLLVALHYAVQLTRPRMGFGSDQGKRRTPWIVGGMATLALGGVGAAASTAYMGTSTTAGIAAAAFCFVLVGLGVSASGTSLLVLLATRVQPERRAAAATVVWVMMIVGFAVTAGLAGKFLDPYSPERLVAVSASVSAIAFAVAMVALWGVENSAAHQPAAAEDKPSFVKTLREVWLETDARRFTVFVFVSMVAYSAQDLILEPFAGLHFGFTPGESTALSGVQHGGTLAGMLLAALAGRRIAGVAFGNLRTWIVCGCLASAVALLGLVAGVWLAPGWPLRANVFALGVANGAFSIAAIGSMMALAGQGINGKTSPGTRMGLWGAAQAIGFALGGVLGTAASDLARVLLGSQVAAYGSVFAVEAVMFVVAAVLALRIHIPLSANAKSDNHSNTHPETSPAQPGSPSPPSLTPVFPRPAEVPTWKEAP
jgi:MFS transporter, BCD family, chlorophyll transporter